jgi:hypothetical protein
MNSKTFTSPSGWFTLKLSENWDEYDDGEEGTYAFFNTIKWTGNLRITPLKWSGAADSSKRIAAKFVADELMANPDARKTAIGDFECAFYSKPTKQDGEDLLIYYWITGKEDIQFTCSFTLDRKNELH